MMHYITLQTITFKWADKEYEGTIVKAHQFECGYAIRFGEFKTSLVALDYATRKWSNEQLKDLWQSILNKDS